MRYPWQKANGKPQSVADVSRRDGYPASDETGMGMEMGLADNGATAHADFMNGRDQALLSGLVDECVIDKQKCEEDEYPACWPSQCRPALPRQRARTESVDAGLCAAP